MSVDELNRDARLAFNVRDDFAAIFGIAESAGADGLDALDSEFIASFSEFFDRAGQIRFCIATDAATAEHVFAEANARAFVFENEPSARFRPLTDEKPNRIRADINGCDSHGRFSVHTPIIEG